MASRRIWVTSAWAVLLAALGAALAGEVALAVSFSQFELAPEEVEFEEVEAGERAVRTVTATSVGNDGVAIERVELTDGGQEFAVAEDGCAGRTLPPGESCGVTVAFEPIDEGEEQAVLAVIAQSAIATRRVPLRGIGVPAAVEDADPDAGGDADEPSGTDETADNSSVDTDDSDENTADDQTTDEEATDDTTDEEAADGQTTDEEAADDQAADEDEGVETGASDRRGWLLWALAGLLGATTARRALRGRRSARWVRAHVRVRPAADLAAQPLARDTDGRGSHALRVAPRADAGAHDVEEVAS